MSLVGGFNRKFTGFTRFSERKKRIAARTQKLNKTTPVDVEELIENRVRNFKDNSFVFLTYAYPRSSERFGPYLFL